MSYQFIVFVQLNFKLVYLFMVYLFDLACLN